MPIGSQAIARTAIFGTCARRKLCDHRENGTVGTVSVVKQYSLISGPWPVVLDRIGYLGSGFAHLLPDVYGSDVRSTPSTSMYVSAS